jgi:hypothetical protein
MNDASKTLSHRSDFLATERFGQNIAAFLHCDEVISIEGEEANNGPVVFSLLQASDV